MDEKLQKFSSVGTTIIFTTHSESVIGSGYFHRPATFFYSLVYFTVSLYHALVEPGERENNPSAYLYGSVQIATAFI